MKSHYAFKKHVLFITMILIGSSVFSQTFNMRDTTVNLCSGTLFDTGGPGSDYGDDEDSAFAIVVNSNSTITITFAFFNLRNSGDELVIFDGPDTNASILAGPYQGNSTPPNATSTGNAITIKFRSDGNQKDPGFELSWLATEDTINTSIAASANPFCLGTPVTFTVTDSSNAGNADFSWEINNSAAAGSGNSFQYTTSALVKDDVVRVIMTPEAGRCIFNPIDSAEIIMDTLVELFPSVSITASDFGICSGQNVTFSVTDSTNGGSNPSFQWQLNGVNVGGDSYQYNSTTINDNDQVRVYMNSNSTGCLAQLSDTSSSIVMNVNPNPSAGIASQINTACFGVDTASATAMGSGGSGTLTYSWNTAPVQNNITATALSAGSHQVTVTDDSACFDTASVLITSPAQIVPVFTVTDATSFGGANGSINTTVSGGVVAVDYTYSWNTVPIQTTKDISGLVSRTYKITITDDTGCVVMDSAFVDQPALLTGGSIEVSGGGATTTVCDGDIAGLFVENTPSSGGTGPFVYTWQYSDNFLTWNNIALSNTNTNFNYTAILTADQFLRRKIVDQNNNDSAFSNAIFLDYIPDIALAITGISSPYCKNDAADILGGVPAGGTFGPLTYMSGSTFSPGLTPGAGPNYNITYDYTDGNGCLSTLTEGIIVNDTTTLTFGLNPTYAPGSPLDSLNPKATPSGGSFSGVGVTQTAPGVYLFDPNVPAAGSTVPITYTLNNGSCVSTITDSTVIVNTNVTLTGFQPDLVYCVTDGIDVINVDLGANPPTVIQDSIEILNVTNNSKYPPVAEMGTYANRSFNLNPATLTPIVANDYRIRVTYTYGVLDTQITILPPFFQVDTAYFKVVQEFSLVYTGRPVPSIFGQVNLSKLVPNSNGSAGNNFQYCENLSTVKVAGTYPNFGTNRSFIHSFNTGGGAGVMHSGNSDTATMDLSVLRGQTDILTYVFEDSASACSTEVARLFRVDTLPIPNLILNASNDFCANDGRVFVNATPYDTTNSLFFSQNGTLPINNPFSQTSSFDAIPSNEGNHKLYYQFTNSSTGCVGTDSSTFSIDSVPVVSIGLDTANIVFNGSIPTICLSEKNALIFGEIGGVYSPAQGAFTAIPGLTNLNNNSTRFNASVAGVQPFPGHMIEYKYTDGNGCKDSARVGLVVNGLPNSNFTIPSKKDRVCDVDDPIAMIANTLNPNETQSYAIKNLSGTTLFNGMNNIYNPGTQTNSAGQLGTDTIVRTVIDTFTECISVTKKSIFINPDPQPIINSLLSTYCLNTGDVGFTFTPSYGNLPTNSPQGDYPVRNYLLKNYGGGTFDSIPLIQNEDSSTIKTQKVSPITKEIRVTYFHTVDSSGCSATVDTLISVVDLPEITVDKNIPNPVYCYGTGNGNVFASPPLGSVTVDSVIAFGTTTYNPVNATYSFNTIIPGGQSPGTTTINPIQFFFTENTSGCYSDTIYNVSIERSPTADFKFVDEDSVGSGKGNHSDTTICRNDNGRIVFESLQPILLNGGTRDFYLNGINTPSNDFAFEPVSFNNAVIVGANTGRYIYTTANGCRDTAEQVIMIHPNPDPAWIIPSLCASGNVLFRDNSSVPSAFGIGDTIYRRSWDFGEGPSSEFTVLTDTLSYKFNNAGSKIIELSVTTGENCSATLTESVQFNDPPIADFAWQRATETYGGLDSTNSFTVDFVALSDLDGVGDKDSVKYFWDYGDLSAIDTTILTSHTFNSGRKTYEITLTNELNGCTDIKKKLLIARPTITVYPYFENFGVDKDTVINGDTINLSTTGGWELEYDYQRDTVTAASDPQNISRRWSLGAPLKADLTGGHGFDSLNACWVTGLDTGDYYRTKDTTYITSPIFDFSSLQKPMIKVWLNHDMNSNDGVVLEYSTDEVITTYTNWTPLNSENAQYGAGINWFNDDGIASSPGKQTAQEKNVGWNGNSDLISIDKNSNGWYEARHDLDDLAGKSYVRFRFALGSGESNLTDQKFGFAFDDIWIGERTRGVLLESFVNTKSQNSKGHNDYISSLVSNNPLDFYNIQYHTDFPFSDPLNIVNQADPSARSKYYGIVEAPSLRMNGNQDASLNIAEKKIQLQALKEPVIDIYMKTTPSATSLAVTAVLRGNDRGLNQLLAEFNHTVKDVSLHLVLLEKSIDAADLPALSVTNGQTEFNNTVKRMLPSAVGTKFFNNWKGSQQYTVSQTFNFNQFTDNDNDWVMIGFVQDNETKEVYQVVYNDGNNPSSPPLGVNDQSITDLNFDYLVYPNPASELVNILLYQKSNQPLNMIVFNQLGAVMTENVIAANALNQTIDVRNYSRGIYYVVIFDAKGNKKTKKLMITR